MLLFEESLLASCFCLTFSGFPLHCIDHHWSRAGGRFLWYWLGFLQEMTQRELYDTHTETKHSIHVSWALATQEERLKVSPNQSILPLSMTLLTLPGLGCSCLTSSL